MNAYQSHAKTGVLVDAAVFDLGGVLIDWNPRHLYRRLFGGDVAGMERFLADVCSPVWNARQDAGRSWDEAIAEAVAAHPEHADLIRAFRECWAEMLRGALSVPAMVQASHCLPEERGWRNPVRRSFT